MLRVIMGISNGLYFITSGSSDSRGSRSFIRSIFSLMRSAAKSMFSAHPNSAITKDRPSLDILFSLLIPLTVPIASSTGFVMSVSISSGAAFS